MEKSNSTPALLRIVLLTTFSVLVIFTSGCGTGRPAVPPGEIPRAPLVTPEDEDYGQQVLGELTKKHPLDRTDAYINRTRDIVERLAKAARAEKAPWHVYVLSGDTVVNAAATRGNYVFVWTGMLLKAQTDGELATVLAHELGHVLAGHTMPTPAEEAAAIMAEVSGQVVSGVLSQTQYGILADLAGMLVQSAITAMVVNPASQANEREADQIGFFLMADASYDPHEALSLWAKMARESSSGSETLSFLSSHPTSESRLQDLEVLLPEALKRFEQSKLQLRGTQTPALASRPQPSPNTSSRNPTTTKPPRRQEKAPRAPQTTDELSERGAWYVITESETVRTDPDQQAPSVATLRRGDKVQSEFRIGTWYKISLPKSGFILGTSINRRDPTK